MVRAYDATNVAVEIYNSSGRDPRHPGSGDKVQRPLIANGRVYVASKTKLTVFGLLQ
jgi:hypothetical protein